MLLQVSKCPELWSTNSLKLDRRFYPPSVNSAAFYFNCQASDKDADQKTELNQTLPNGSKQRYNNLPYRKVGVVPPEKNRGQNFYIFFET